MVIRRAMLVAALAFPLAAGSALAQAQAQAPSREEERQEQKIDLARVPAAATNAARQALNVPITEAYEAGQQNGQAVYELEGRDQQGREVSVHVTASGQVVKRESEHERERDRD